eukprot:TRINITY_DN4117_c0_g4_i1.p1 TRINITY_DN4117_c0_g4~~TRINITY_DN4117_c0_g4_i1.p1  ORF type:complete len:720 (+),score=90.91 TRINITY_DN4117_c0_g4_i1:182-2341(+)
MQQPPFLKASDFFYNTPTDSTPLTTEWKEWFKKNNKYVKTRTGTPPSSKTVVLESNLTSAASANLSPDAEFLVDHSAAPPGLVFIASSFDNRGRKLSLYAHVLCYTKKPELAIVPLDATKEQVALRLFVPKEGTKGVEMHVVDETHTVNRVKVLTLKRIGQSALSQRRSNAASDQNRIFSFDVEMTPRRSFLVQCSSGGAWQIVLGDLDSDAQWTFDIKVLGGHSKSDQKKIFFVDVEESSKKRKLDKIISKKKCVVMVGGSGVGKSTLLNCLMGCVTFASGPSSKPLTRTIAHATASEVEYYDTPAMSNQNFDQLQSLLWSLADDCVVLCFLVTLESSRLKDYDRYFIARLTLAQLLHSNVHFQVIINKSHPLHSFGDLGYQIRRLLPAGQRFNDCWYFQHVVPELEDTPNATKAVPELLDWVQKSLFPTTPLMKSVRELLCSTYSERLPHKRISLNRDNNTALPAPSLGRAVESQPPQHLLTAHQDTLSARLYGAHTTLKHVPLAYTSELPPSVAFVEENIQCSEASVHHSPSWRPQTPTELVNFLDWEEAFGYESFGGVELECLRIPAPPPLPDGSEISPRAFFQSVSFSEQSGSETDSDFDESASENGDSVRHQAYELTDAAVDTSLTTMIASSPYWARSIIILLLFFEFIVALAFAVLELLIVLPAAVSRQIFVSSKQFVSWSNISPQRVMITAAWLAALVAVLTLVLSPFPRE